MSGARAAQDPESPVATGGAGGDAADAPGVLGGGGGRSTLGGGGGAVKYAATGLSTGGGAFVAAGAGGGGVRRKTDTLIASCVSPGNGRGGTCEVGSGENKAAGASGACTTCATPFAQSMSPSTTTAAVSWSRFNIRRARETEE